jgi:hypothetical protein
MLKVTQRPLNWLLDHQTVDNPKDHDIEEIGRSLVEHGFVEPVMLDERTDLVLGGHGRLEVLAMMRNDGTDPPEHIGMAGSDWLIPTLEGVRSKDEADAKKLLVRLNRLSERGGWNAEKLTAFDLDDDFLTDMWEPGELDDLFGDDEIEDDPEGADNEHADLPPARIGEPPPPRIAQGINEMVLQLQADHYTEAKRHIANLSHIWGEKVTGLIILRALRKCAEEVQQVSGHATEQASGGERIDSL